MLPVDIDARRTAKPKMDFIDSLLAFRGTTIYVSANCTFDRSIIGSNK